MPGPGRFRGNDLERGMNLLLRGGLGNRGHTSRPVPEHLAISPATAGHSADTKGGRPQGVDAPTALCVRVSVAAQMIGIGRTKLYELIEAGELSTLKIGSATLITTDSIVAFIERSIRN